MLLKLNRSLCLDLPSPVTNKHFIGENIGPLFVSILLVLRSLNSLHTHGRTAHPRPLTCGGQTGVSVLRILWGLRFLEPAALLVLSPAIMGNPPCSARHQLAVPAGCPQTLERYQADRASILAAKTQQMHHTEDSITKIRGLTFTIFSLTHKHIFRAKYKHCLSSGVSR